MVSLTASPSGPRNPAIRLPWETKLAVGVGDTDTEIEHLVNDGALRSALKRDEHLVADRSEAFAQHVHGEPGVASQAVGCHGRSSMIRLPASSRRVTWPGNTSVVAAASSITHGPATHSRPV